MKIAGKQDCWKKRKKNLLQGQQETQGVLKNKILSDKSWENKS